MARLAALLATAAALGGPALDRGGGHDGPSIAPAGRGAYCDPATGCTGGTSFFGHTAEELFVVDIGGGTPRVTPVGPFGTQISDIARTPDGRLFGVSFNALFAIDQRTGRATTVGPLGVQDVNGLVAAGQGLLASSTDGILYEIDPQTGRASRVGAFGRDITSSGDLCFGPGGALYMTAPAPPQQPGADRLVRVDPRTGAAAVIGTTGTGRIYGLAWAGGGLVGLSEAGLLVRLDPGTGAGTIIGSGGVPFWGGS